MIAAEFVRMLAKKQPHLRYSEVKLIIDSLMEHIVSTIVSGRTIQIPGFGAFSIKTRMPRVGVNPETGQPIAMTMKYIPHYRPLAAMRKKINDAREAREALHGKKSVAVQKAMFRRRHKKWLAIQP